MQRSHHRVVVVTDSSASLPQGAAARWGIRVVPMTLILEGTVYPDGELSPAEVVRRSTSAHVSTSGPSPGDFLKSLDGVDEAPGAVIVTVSSKMSGTYESAMTGAGYLDGDRARVVDSGTAAGAQGLVTLAAARHAASGASLDAVERTAREISARVRLMAGVEDLRTLAQSGRVPGLAARAGRIMGVRPLFEFGHGQVRPRRPALSHAGALERILEACLAETPASATAGIQGPRLHAAVLHAQAPELAEELEKMLLARVTDADLFVAPFSSVMVVHTGPGLIGLAWWWEGSG